jgi:hypothetical protein
MHDNRSTRRRVQFLLPDEPPSGHVYIWRLFDNDKDIRGTPIYVGMSANAGLDRALSHAKGAIDALRGSQEIDGERTLFAKELGRIISAAALLDLEIAFVSDDRNALLIEEARLIKACGLRRAGDGSLYNIQRGKGSSRQRRISEAMSNQSAAVAATWQDPAVRAARSARNHTLVNGICFYSFYAAMVDLGIDARFAPDHIKIRTDLNKQPAGTRLARWGVEIENQPYDANLFKSHAKIRKQFAAEYIERLQGGEFDAAEYGRLCSKNMTLPDEYLKPDFSEIP